MTSSFRRSFAIATAGIIACVGTVTADAGVARAAGADAAWVAKLQVVMGAVVV